MLKILFMGTPAFSVPILEELVEKYQVVGVVTQPDRKVGRKQEVLFPPVKEVAIKHQIPLFQPEKVKKIDDELIALAPDLIVTAAFGQMVSRRLIEFPKYGAINVHGSLLPKYRGGAPIQRAIMNGDTSTGITIMYMVDRMDAGDILASTSIPIEESDTTGTLFGKLSLLGRDLLMDTIPQLISGKIVPIPQNESEVTYAYTLKPEDEVLDLQKDAKTLTRQIRALLPEPAGYFMLGEDRIKIYQARESVVTHNNQVGEIINVTKDCFTIACGFGTALDIFELQAPGKRKMMARDFINGGLKKYLK